MRPSPTLIPRLLPILKHVPNPSSATSPSSSPLLYTSPRINPSPAHHINLNHGHPEEINGNANGWATWWLPNPLTSVKSAKVNDKRIRKSISPQHPTNDHTHLQTSLTYHNHPHQTLTTSTSSTTYKDQSSIRSNKPTKSKEQTKQDDDHTSGVPPPTIAWNDYLSMV